MPEASADADEPGPHRRSGPDAETLAWGSNDRTIRLWNATTREVIGTLEGHEANVLSLAFVRTAAHWSRRTTRGFSCSGTSRMIEAKMHGHDSPHRKPRQSPRR